MDVLRFRKDLLRAVQVPLQEVVLGRPVLVIMSTHGRVRVLGDAHLRALAMGPADRETKGSQHP